MSEKSKKTAVAATAFAAGAAFGAAAGLMTKKKNRQRVVRVAKKAKGQAEIKAKELTEKAKETVGKVLEKLEKSQESGENPPSH